MKTRENRTYKFSKLMKKILEICINMKYIHVQTQLHVGEPKDKFYINSRFGGNVFHAYTYLY